MTQEINMRRHNIVRALAIGFVGWGACAAHAQVTSTNSISFQAKLDGVTTPTVDLTFQFWNAAVDGLAIGPPILRSGVAVTAGVVSTAVPVTAATFNGQDRWLSVSVNGGGQLSPRTLVSSVPYALTALGVSQPAVTAGPQLSQNRLMLGSEATGDSNVVLQIDHPNTPTARTILQGVHSQGNAFADLYLNPGGGNVYLWRHSIIGSDAPGGAYVSIDVSNLDTEIQAVRSQGSSWGTINLNSSGGNVTIAPNGTTTVRVLTITGADVAEPFDVTKPDGAQERKAGMVVSIDPKNPGKLMLASTPYDKKVAGAISGANGLDAGVIMGKDNASPLIRGEYPVAMSGRVWVLCDASPGSIEPGDRLTTSGTPGHGMKVTDEGKAPGAVFGKAMTGLKEGKGLVLVLVNLQ